jgi:hypothetical protein
MTTNAMRKAILAVVVAVALGVAAVPRAEAYTCYTTCSKLGCFTTCN